MPLPPVSPLAGPLKTLSNTNPIPEHKWKIRNMRNKKKRSSLQKRHLKKTLRHKTFEEPMNIFFHATVDGVTVIKSAECFETMEEFAYIMFSHNFCDKGRVNLSISVSGLDGIPKSVYNLADVKYLRCFVNAHGRTEPRSQKCHVIAAHFCNDPNGNPDLLSEQWIRFRFFASVGRFPALNTWMACLSRYIHPPSPLARPYLAQQDEQKEEPPVNLDILAEKPRKWKKETSFLVKFLRIQILNKQLEKPVILRFHVTVGAPNAEERCYLTKKVITMRRITEYVHIDFENEIDLPVEVMIVCQSFDRGDTLLLSAKNIRYWEGYCDIHGRNKKVRKGWIGHLKVQLISTVAGPTLYFS